MPLSGKALKTAVTEFEQLLEKTPAKKVVNELDRLLEKQFPGRKDDAERVMDKILEGLGKRKPAPPKPSVPAPKLTREPAPAAGAKPARKPKTAPRLTGDSRKQGKTDTRPSGLITMKNVDAIVRQVLDGVSLRKVIAFIPGGTEAIFIKDTLSGELSDSDKIIDICQNYVLKQNNKRQRERLAVPGKYPNGTKKIDIMRRMKGTGYRGEPRPRKGKKPKPAMADKIPASPPKPTDKGPADMFPAEIKEALQG